MVLISSGAIIEEYGDLEYFLCQIINTFGFLFQVCRFLCDWTLTDVVRLIVIRHYALELNWGSIQSSRPVPDRHGPFIGDIYDR